MGVPLLCVLSMKAWNDRLNVVVKDGYRVLTRDVIKHAATSALLDAALLRLRDMPLVILTSEASHIKVKSIADGKAKGEVACCRQGEGRGCVRRRTCAALPREARPVCEAALRRD